VRKDVRKLCARDPEKRKGRAATRPNFLKSLVGTTGFEPATPASRMQCSTRLSHVPTPLNYSLLDLVSSACSAENCSPDNPQLGGFKTTGLPWNLHSP
jgi:hypothetical protein